MASGCSAVGRRAERAARRGATAAQGAVAARLTACTDAWWPAGRAVHRVYNPVELPGPPADSPRAAAAPILRPGDELSESGSRNRSSAAPAVTRRPAAGRRKENGGQSRQAAVQGGGGAPRPGPVLLLREGQRRLPLAAGQGARLLPPPPPPAPAASAPAARGCCGSRRLRVHAPDPRPWIAGQSCSALRLGRQQAGAMRRPTCAAFPRRRRVRRC